jgi:hypothetical protein
MESLSALRAGTGFARICRKQLARTTDPAAKKMVPRWGFATETQADIARSSNSDTLKTLMIKSLLASEQ